MKYKIQFRKNRRAKTIICSSEATEEQIMKLIGLEIDKKIFDLEVRNLSQEKRDELLDKLIQIENEKIKNEQKIQTLK